MVGQHTDSLCLGNDLAQRLLVQTQIQQQRLEARLQRAEKCRDPKRRIFHFERKKSALFSGKPCVQHTRDALRQRGQLTVAHAQRAAGAVLLGKGRVRKFCRKNAENIFKPALRCRKVAQLPLPKNHSSASVGLLK